MRYYIADLHNYDPYIIVYEHRPFSDCEEMREALVSKWNDAVSSQDEGFILGDIGDPEIIRELNGKRITIVVGNHDSYDEIRDMYGGDRRVEISRHPIMVGGCICSHEPVVSMPPELPYINIHGHTHHLPYGLTDRPWAEGRRHFCVSAEQTGYAPISEVGIIGKIGYAQGQRRPAAGTA